MSRKRTIPGPAVGVNETTVVNPGYSPEIVIHLLSRGLVAEWRRMRDDGDIYFGPDRSAWLTQALASLSRLCLESGCERDLGSDPILVSHLATRPLREWGIPGFKEGFEQAELILIDPDLHLPTIDAFEVAGEHEGPEDAQEDGFHKLFRASVAAVRDKPEQDRLYTIGRTFPIRNPVVTGSDLTNFLHSYPALRSSISAFYRPAPKSTAFAGIFRMCAGCGSLLFPDADVGAYPNGRCRIRECREDNHASGVSRTLDDADYPYLAQDAILSYWVGPGLGEIAIHDALLAQGRDVVLYPHSDAADVGVDGDDIGIDVKSYASPENLGRHFRHRGIGGLTRFARRIVAIPDAKVRKLEDYATRLERFLDPAWGLEIMSVSETIKRIQR